MRHELTEQEYDCIVEYLQKTGVTDAKQQGELADHLAVVTELHMDSGKPFDDAFAQAKAQLNPEELTIIRQHAATFTYYPRFLGKRFLTGLAVLCLVVFFTGLYLKHQHLPYHRLWIIIGRRSFVFVLLPLWLLYNLTEFANKTRQVLTFLFMFTAAQTGFDLLVKHRLNWILAGSALFTGLLWIILFNILPTIKARRRLQP